MGLTIGCTSKGRVADVAWSDASYDARWLRPPAKSPTPAARRLRGLPEESFEDLRIEPIEFVDLGSKLVVVVAIAGLGRAGGAPRRPGRGLAAGSLHTPVRRSPRLGYFLPSRRAAIRRHRTYVCDAGAGALGCFLGRVRGIRGSLHPSVLNRFRLISRERKRCLL
jgi:hypothetical protein